MNRGKVAVGISGGVDSAIAALLLKEQGYDVTAVHLYCWPPKSEIEKDGLTREEWIKKNGCRADEDRGFALKTALELAIPFKVLDFSEEYNTKVIKYFYDEYEAGRTPNPDVMCNSEIKFGLFLNWALENDFDYIATGHYAKLEDSKLMIPADKHKDQTYFLWKLTQKKLGHTLFPLGDLTKTEVREMAEKANLSVAKRKDSQGICFVGNVEAREFLARRLKNNPGKVVDVHGEEIGVHDGVWFYTIGQRGGWEITPSAQRKFAGNGVTPVFYVMSKDAKTNTLVVGEEDEAKGDQFEVGEINRISKTKWNMDDLIVRIRHGGELIGARGMENDDGLMVFLDRPMRGIASGQSAVFYTHEGECLGGGVIG
jgi:tRNA-uridine 2-sulfurtransferase